ncbi:MAG: phosphonate ABC transporter, permease protein PhnE [Acidimicrobiia bacterium]|nr:phosphonate ABC transporter, permease protein PhnE [Acidimicrobiia bacterium]
MTATRVEPESATAERTTILDRLPLRPPWPWRKKLLAGIGITTVAAFLWGSRRVGLSPAALAEGYGDFMRLLERMLPPEFRNPDEIVSLAIQTFYIAFIGTAIAVALSLPLAFMAARNTTPNRVAYSLSRGFIVAMRAIPDLIFALIFVRAIGIGVTAGILAIALNAIGMIGKLFADAIEQIDEGPREAVLAAGGTRRQAIITGVLPQVLPSFIGTTLYRLDINFRTSTILGYVGAGGIGSLLQLYLGSLQYKRALGVTLVIVVLVLVIEFVSAWIRRSILGSDDFEAKRLSRRAHAALRRGRASAGNGSASGVHVSSSNGTGPAGVEVVARDGAPIASVVDSRAASVLADVGGGGVDGGASPSSLGGLSAVPLAERPLKPPWTTQRVRMAAFGWGSLALLVLSLVSTQVSPWALLTSVGDIASVAVQLVPTNMDWYDSFILEGIVETIAIAVVATCLGLAVAFPLAYLAARNVAPARWVFYAARSVVVMVRAVPELIVAVLFVAAVGLGPFPGAMALAIGTVGFATKLLADAIEEVRPGPREGVWSVGATRMQEAATSVTPQAMPSFVGTSLYVFDINIRAATILGLVGAGGIGFYLIQATRTLDWERVGGILIIVFVLVYAIERLAGWVRKQLI